MSSYDRYLERLGGCYDEECPECGHSQDGFDGGCDECGWASEEDPDDYYDRLHDNV
ncbi:MAG: hypothetical protein M0R06_04630 [Sphaerochaeta sp.]|jgi:hypothetical protein|nr:hypothetical protein [Sphaerochaeta sp.]